MNETQREKQSGSQLLASLPSPPLTPLLSATPPNLLSTLTPTPLLSDVISPVENITQHLQYTHTPFKNNTCLLLLLFIVTNITMQNKIQKKHDIS